jgi:hypothetical protein
MNANASTTPAPQRVRLDGNTNSETTTTPKRKPSWKKNVLARFILPQKWTDSAAASKKSTTESSSSRPAQDTNLAMMFVRDDSARLLDNNAAKVHRAGGERGAMRRRSLAGTCAQQEHFPDQPVAAHSTKTHKKRSASMDHNNSFSFLLDDTSANSATSSRYSGNGSIHFSEVCRLEAKKEELLVDFPRRGTAGMSNSSIDWIDEAKEARSCDATNTVVVDEEGSSNNVEIVKPSNWVDHDEDNKGVKLCDFRQS